MDLEMTGLDPDVDVIVEIASLVTDDDLNIVAEGPDLVIYAPEAALAAMDPVVGFYQAARATSAQRAVVWQLHWHRSAFSRQVPP